MSADRESLAAAQTPNRPNFTLVGHSMVRTTRAETRESAAEWARLIAIV